MGGGGASVCGPLRDVPFPGGRPPGGGKCRRACFPAGGVEAAQQDSAPLGAPLRMPGHPDPHRVALSERGVPPADVGAPAGERGHILRWRVSPAGVGASGSIRIKSRPMPGGP